MQDEGAAIMGLGHTLMEQLPLRRRTAGSGTSARSTTGSRHHGPAARDAQRDRRERRRARPVRREGHERGRAAVRRAGGGRGGPRRDRRRDPRPAADPGAGLAGAPGRGAVDDPVDVRARRPARRVARRGTGAARRQGGQPRDDGRRPGAAGAARRSRSRPRPAARTWRRAGRTGSTTSSAPAWRRSRRAVGRRFGDAADPLLVSRPVGGAAVDARDDGHDPQPRAQRGDRGRAGRASRRAPIRARLPRAVRGEVPLDRRRATRRPIRGASCAGRSRPCSARGTADRAARTAREEGIPDDLGTGVTVQAMVFGNRGADSATGVLFTRNPATGEAELYGDVLFDAQGEDVVAGTHATEPIAALDERLPDGGRRAAPARRHARAPLRATVRHRVHDRAGPAVAAPGPGRQAEPQAALRMAVDMAEDPDFPLTREEAVRRVLPLLADPPPGRPARAAAPCSCRRPGSAPRRGSSAGRSHQPRRCGRGGRGGHAGVLVRAETSPDDVHGMARAAGILTSRGGLASHAAVVARGWGIPAVVGAAAVVVGDGDRVDRRPGAGGGRDDHDRRRHRRGLRGRRARHERGRARGRDVARLGRELGIAVGERDGRAVGGAAVGRAPGVAGPLSPRHLAEGIRAARGRRGCGPVDAGRRAPGRRPAGARRAGRDDRRRLQAHRRGHDAGRIAGRGGTLGVGRGRGGCRARRVPRPRPPDQGHGHGLAAPRRRQRQRPRGRFVRRRGPRAARRAARGRDDLARADRGRLPAARRTTASGSATRSRQRGAATAGTSPHPASTATTGSGSSSTRT